MIVSVVLTDGQVSSPTPATPISVGLMNWKSEK